MSVQLTLSQPAFGKAHVPDPVYSVRLIWSADRSHSSAGGALAFLRDRLAHQEEVFAAFSKGTWNVKNSSFPSRLKLNA